MTDQKLRPIVEADLPLVREWRNADDVRINMYTHHVISEDEHRAWWNRVKDDPSKRLFIFEVEGTPAGVITFTGYTGPGGTATWAFYSGDRARRGIGSLMERAALVHAFEKLELRKLDCEVLGFNEAVISFHLKHGFRVEGIFREAYQRDGKAHDIWRLAMFRRDWERAVRRVLAERAERGGRDEKDLTGKAREFRVVVTPERVRHFSEASGDANPIHHDPQAAAAAGFEGPICQGLLAGSLISGVFGMQFPGPGTVYLSQQLRFLAPILVGDEVTIRLKVLTHMGRRMAFRTQVLARETVCVDGEAEVLSPPHLAT